MTLTTFIFLALAAWRLANLLCNEAGPFGIFRIIRNSAEILCQHYKLCKAYGLDELVTCEYCASVYIGAVLVWGYLTYGNPVLYVAIAFALSTCVIILKYIHQGLQKYAS